MSEERLYYIKSVDQWLTYEEAHSYGLTKKKPTELTFYTEELQPVIIRKDTDTNELWDFREEVPHEWSSDISELGLYKKLGTVTIYQGEAPVTCVGYTDSALSNELKYVYLDSIFTELETIYYSRGITPYKCSNYIIQEGEVLAWYDAIHDPPMYWNNQVGYKRWQSSPPETVKKELQDVYIAPNTGMFEFWSTWEDYQVVPRYIAYSFNEHESMLSGQGPFIVGFQLLDHFDEHVNLTSDLMYQDKNTYGTTFYVFPEEGATDYTGIHREQGYSYTGDVQIVWTESDEDVTFWRGSTTYVFGQSWDDYNPEIFWCSSVYMLYTELHDAGYTRTEATDIEVWDPSLLYEYEITDLIVSFSANNTGQPYTLLANTVYRAVFTSNLLQSSQCESIGLHRRPMYSDNVTFTYDSNYVYEIMAIYSDIFGENEIPFSPEDFTFGEDISNHVLSITSNKAYNNVCTWKLRIYPRIELVLAFMQSGGVFQPTTFTAGLERWAEFRNQGDVNLANRCGIKSISTGTPYGEVEYNNNYSYTPLALYSDLNGTQLNTDDMSNFTCQRYDSSEVISIRALEAYETPSLSWKLLISRINKSYIDVVLALKYNSSYDDGWMIVNFDYQSGNYWWAEITNQDDLTKLQNLGIARAEFPFGEVQYNSDYSYKVLRFYSDIGNTPVEMDLSKFYFTAGPSTQDLAIYCSTRLTPYVKSYKLRIYIPN